MSSYFKKGREKIKNIKKYNNNNGQQLSGRYTKLNMKHNTM